MACAWLPAPNAALTAPGRAHGIAGWIGLCETGLPGAKFGRGLWLRSSCEASETLVAAACPTLDAKPSSIRFPWRLQIGCLGASVRGESAPTI